MDKPLEVVCEFVDTRQLKKLYNVMDSALIQTSDIFQKVVDRYPRVSTISNLHFVLDTSHEIFTANTVNKIVQMLQDYLGKIDNSFEVDLPNGFDSIEVTYNVNR